MDTHGQLVRSQSTALVHRWGLCMRKIKNQLFLYKSKTYVVNSSLVSENFHNAKMNVPFAQVHFEGLGKFYYLLFNCSRQVDDSVGILKYKRVDGLILNSVDLTFGKKNNIKEFPKNAQGEIIPASGLRQSHGLGHCQ
jgi:hypothetical protein